MPDLKSLKIKIFADGADLAGMKAMYANPMIKGFTTNPTLMKAAGVADYAEFARKVLSAIPDRPVSFEVFADDFDEMEHQAMEIASWGRNVNVKIPVTNTKMDFCGPLVSRLSKRGVPTSILTPVKHTTVDVARGDQVFGKVLSQMLPLLLLMTGMLGALFPALNATTTERPSTGANSNSMGLQSVSTGELLCFGKRLCRRRTFADPKPRCTYTV